MDGNHPITPPEGLVREWECDLYDRDVPFDTVIREAYRAGADWELEACIDLLGGQLEWDVLSQCTGWKEFRDKSEEILRAARRPKSVGLKELALAALDVIEDKMLGPTIEEKLIRRALEQLDD